MYVLKRLTSHRQAFLNLSRINGRSRYLCTSSSPSPSEPPQLSPQQPSLPHSYRLGSGEDYGSAGVNEFLSRFVWIMRKKLSEVYPESDKETANGMLRVIAEAVLSEIEGVDGQNSNSPAPEEFSEDLWATVREVSATVMGDMKKAAKKEKMKKFLQSPEVKEMTRFAVEVGVRGDMLRDMRFRWACEKLEEAEFQESLDSLREGGEEDEREEAAVSMIPERRGNIGYKIYGLDLSDPKWAEAAGRVSEVGQTVWPDDAKPILGKCSVVNGKILSLKDGDDLLPLLADWVELLQPGRTDWNVLLAGLKENNSSVYFKLAEHLLSEESFQTSIRDYSNLIDAYAKANRLEDAERIIQKMKENGIAVDLPTATVLVHMYCKVGDLNRAEEAYNTLKISGFLPDQSIYTSMITAYINANKPSKAYELMREMENKNYRPTEGMYMSLLRLFSQIGDASSADTVYTSMMMKESVTSYKTYKSLVEVFSEVGNVKRAREHFETILKLRDRPDDECTSSIIAAYEKKNMLSEALSLLSKLEKDGSHLGVLTYVVLVDWLGKLQLIDEAEHILGKISELGEAPPFKLQISLCDMYSRAGYEKKALQAFGVLEAKKEELGSAEFERIIKALVAGKFTMQANRMLELMEARGFDVPEQLKMVGSQSSGEKDDQ